MNQPNDTYSLSTHCIADFRDTAQETGKGVRLHRGVQGPSLSRYHQQEAQGQVWGPKVKYEGPGYEAKGTFVKTAVQAAPGPVRDQRPLEVGPHPAGFEGCSDGE